MFLEITLAILIGMTAGVFTGLIPGLHVNLISVIVVGIAFQTSVQPFFVLVFLIALALTHSFLDSIPSVYLGAPDPSLVVAVLPAHQLFLEGKGRMAVLFTLFGSYFSLLFSLLLAPAFYLILTPLAEILSPYIGKILLGLVIILCVLSKHWKNVLFFLLSGLLGFLCFETSLDQVLLPLLTGLFGTSTLLMSLLSTTTQVTQQVTVDGDVVPYTQVESISVLATITGFFASFLPGFGSSQGAIFASLCLRKKTPMNYLLLVGGINTVNFTLSLLTFLLLFKARNGAIASISSYLVLDVQHLWLLAPVILMVGSCATLLGIQLSKTFISLLNNISQTKITKVVLVFLLILVCYFTGWQGFLILITATSLGILAQYYAAQKNMLLGCLLLSVMFYLW